MHDGEWIGWGGICVWCGNMGVHLASTGAVQVREASIEAAIETAKDTPAPEDGGSAMFEYASG